MTPSIVPRSLAFDHVGPSRTGQRAAECLLVSALLLLHAWLAISAVEQKSLTFDEPAHATGGMSLLATGDYRFSDANHWPQVWIALPMKLQGAQFPSLAQPGWWEPDVYIMGDQFFFRAGNDAAKLQRAGRSMVVLLSVILALIVWAWARWLFGFWGGLIALVLYCLDPTMLAHGSLMTADMPAALAFTLALAAIWLCLRKLTPLRIVGSSLAVVLLLLTKSSGVLIIPVALLLALAIVAQRQPWSVQWGLNKANVRTIDSRLARVGLLVGVVVVHVLIAWLVIWAWYGFEYEAFRNPQPGRDRYALSWEEVLSDPGPITQAMSWTRDHQLLPEGYIYNYARYFHVTRQRVAFMDGQTSLVGWPTFFPYTLLVKTPLSLLALFALGALAWLIHIDQRRRAAAAPDDADSTAAPAAIPSHTDTLAADRRLALGWLPLVTLLLVYWLAAVTSQINIGHRHILPTYPAMFIIAGASALLLPRHTRLFGPVLMLIIAFAAAEAWRIYPHHLAYFNQIVGPRNGYRHLVDSSLDWGQDLPGLQQWLHQQQLDQPDAEPVYLSYFGTSDPAYYHIKASLLPGWVRSAPLGVPEPLKPGIYCISATMLQSLYLSAPGPWAVEYERDYQFVLRELMRFIQAREDKTAFEVLLAQQDEDYWYQRFEEFEALRLARLNALLRTREPIAQIGYSILIYRLSAEDVQAVQFGPPAQLLEHVQLRQ